jgi:hypothetical protein
LFHPVAASVVPSPTCNFTLNFVLTVNVSAAFLFGSLQAPNFRLAPATLRLVVWQCARPASIGTSWIASATVAGYLREVRLLMHDCAFANNATTLRSCVPGCRTCDFSSLTANRPSRRRRIVVLLELLRPRLPGSHLAAAKNRVGCQPSRDTHRTSARRALLVPPRKPLIKNV